jgi:hypothetical protein
VAGRTKGGFGLFAPFILAVFWFILLIMVLSSRVISVSRNSVIVILDIIRGGVVFQLPVFTVMHLNDHDVLFGTDLKFALIHLKAVSDCPYPTDSFMPVLGLCPENSSHGMVR